MNPNQDNPTDSQVNVQSSQSKRQSRFDDQSQDDSQTSPKAKLSKKLMIIIVSLLSVLLIVFIAVIIYFATFSVDYKDAYVKSNEVSDSWNSYSLRHNEVSNALSLDISDFDKKLNDEKIAFDKFKTSYKKLENTSMLKDKEIKLKYNNFVSHVNTIIPKVEAYFAVAGPIHDFSSKITKLEGNNILIDTEVDHLVSQLVASDNAKLKQYGQKYALAAKKMYNAIVIYNKTHLAADYVALTAAKTQFSSIVDEMSKLQTDLSVVTSDDISQMTIAWQELNDVISGKYSNSK